MTTQLFDQALQGMPVLGTPSESAHRFLRNSSSPRDAAHRLCRRYALLSGMTGFVCGLPGYVTMPVTIPSNVAGVLLLQFHMCASIAVLAGLDPENEKVRRASVRFVFPLDKDPDEESQGGLIGLLERVGIKLGERGVRFASEQAVRWAGRGARRLPLVGGVVGAYSDQRSTTEVGERAIQAYFEDQAGQ